MTPSPYTTQQRGLGLALEAEGSELRIWGKTGRRALHTLSSFKGLPGTGEGRAEETKRVWPDWAVSAQMPRCPPITTRWSSRDSSGTCAPTFPTARPMWVRANLCFCDRHRPEAMAPDHRVEEEGTALCPTLTHSDLCWPTDHSFPGSPSLSPTRTRPSVWDRQVGPSGAWDRPGHLPLLPARSFSASELSSFAFSTRPALWALEPSLMPIPLPRTPAPRCLLVPEPHGSG